MSKPKELAKSIVERVRRCVITAGGEFDGIQTSFTALPQIIFQTVDGPAHIYRVSFDPDTWNEHLLTATIEQAIARFRESQIRREKMKLKEKLHAIYQSLDAIEKAGHNKSQNYDYVRAADVTRAIRDQFVAQRIYAEINFDFVGGPFTIARAKDKDAPFSAVLVKCSIIFHDLDSDAILTSSGLGTGADSNDKAAYKAQTGALKYALKNAVLAPDEADPEADETVDEQSYPDAEPDFREAARPAQRQTRPAPPEVDENPFESPATAAPSTKSQAFAQPADSPSPTDDVLDVPENVTGKGDAFEEPESHALPTEEELTVYRTKFKTLGDDLTTTGKLKASKGLPVNIKLKSFLLHITKAESPKDITKDQWEDFFARVEKAKAGETGLVGLTKLINKVNGIE